ncbi:hypothetical protein [Paenibacillus soyae]|uniref:Tetratricopeptide repeat protein n=1 Tax=Paenibacillus soyae TaxID=2969249 RepID=A0A9X2MX15_9BACL|nr:hypothetical protein [Paenibacillus soyae]MCR2808005.1 hypothetical protein [Paenibacillus soyae]
MANDGSYENQLKEIKKLHREGVDGDQKAVKLANERLTKLRQSQPGNAIIEAYYGSSLALLARDAAKLTVKEELARESLEALDRAAAIDPGNKEVRLLRANVCLRLPDSHFQTAQTAIEDFSFLLNRNQAAAGYLTPVEVRDVLVNLGKAYETAGRADMAQHVALLLARLT